MAESELELDEDVFGPILMLLSSSPSSSGMTIARPFRLNIQDCNGKDTASQATAQTARSITSK